MHVLFRRVTGKRHHWVCVPKLIAASGTGDTVKTRFIAESIVVNPTAFGFVFGKGFHAVALKVQRLTRLACPCGCLLTMYSPGIKSFVVRMTLNAL